MHQSTTCHSKFDWQTSHYSTIIGQPSRLCMNFILQVFRLVLWFYCLFIICFLVGHLLNKIHVVFDAFDSSCCSYVHKKIQKKKNFWTRGIGPSKTFVITFCNLFLKTFLLFQRLQDFSKASLSKTQIFFFPQKTSFQENTRWSIWKSFFQIMKINCSTNQFYSKGRSNFIQSI